MRSLARWGVLPILAMPLGSLALTVGDVETVNSYLNQPLNADIAFSATPEELASLRVELAPVDDFLNNGIDYPGFLTSVEFEIAQNAAGERVIRVTSGENVTEPFVTMIVVVSHSRGSTSREITLLLDPPLFLSEDLQPEPIAQPVTRQPEPAVSGGPIERPAVQPAVQPPASEAPAFRPQEPVSVAPPPVSIDSGDYTVIRGDTLWGIASNVRPAGVSINQAMISIFEANPAAFVGNINRLRAGAILRIPNAAALGSVQVARANAEVVRQIEAWQGAVAATPQLVLLPPSDATSAGDAGVTASANAAAEIRALEDRVASLEADLSTAAGDLADAERLIDVRNQELADLQQQLAASGAEDPATAADDQLFVDDAGDDAIGEVQPEDVAEDTSDAAAAEETPAPAVQTSPPPPAVEEPSLVDRVLQAVGNPIVWISGGVLVVLLAALAFLRRRRNEQDDVTGQWEALEAEFDEEGDNDATARIRARAGVVVDEAPEIEATAETARLEVDSFDTGTAEIAALVPHEDPFTSTVADDVPVAPESEEELFSPDQTMSSQTVINLDQADPIAEADFHMAYGLYDQAADLITSALEADPENRELKLKLLEVYFVWGNKDQFLEQAKSLRAQLGDGANSDWDKVVIMGKQICPDESLFSGATAAAGEVDLDLEASAISPGLDFALDDEDEEVDLDLSVVEAGDMSIADSGFSASAPADRSDDDFLDIGARTQAGLEAALLDVSEDDEDDTFNVPGIGAVDSDSTMEADDIDFGNAQTLESPTLESPIADAPTVETPTIEMPAADEAEPGETVEQVRPAASARSDMTAELEIDDLGLDIGDLPGEISDLPDPDDSMVTGALSLSETKEQPGPEPDSGILSATGVTQVLDDEEAADLAHSNTAVLGDEEATMMAPGFGDTNTGISTEVLEQPAADFDPDPPETEDDLDLNFEDFSSALEGGETLEQPTASRFSSDVDFDLDLDLGDDVGDDSAAGNELSSFDPQTMTEVGTKLDLARAYIDMGDPEGAKSILEEVVSEGDTGQKSEAQALLKALPV